MTADQTWFSLGVVGMTIGWVGFLAKTRTAPPADRGHYVTSFFIPLWAAAMYLLMAQGYTHVTLSDGHGFWLARYVDWVVTTPLLLLGLAAVAMPSLRSNPALVASLIGADLFMILTGTIGSGISGDSGARYTWFVVSCAAFLAVLGLVFGPLKAEAEAAGGGRAEAFGKLAIFLTALWFVYPVVWLLGSEGLRVISDTLETAVITVVDVTAKVVYGYATLQAVQSLSREASAAHPTRRGSQPARRESALR